MEEMTMKKICISLILIFSLSLFIIQCAQVNYVGKTFSPTSDIDVYYSEHEIEKEFTTIGHAMGSGGFLVSNEKIQDELVKKARSVGADGVIITEVDKSKVIVDDSAQEERHIKATFVKYK
jgi:hypothetical protein